MFGKPMLFKEHSAYTDSDTAAVVGSNLRLSGVADSANAYLVRDFVLASKEAFTGFGEHNGFKAVEQYLQPLQLRAQDGRLYTLSFEKAPARGEQLRHFMLPEKTENGKPMQLQGIVRGTPLTVVGTVTAPGQLRVQYAYAGTPAQYEQFLREGAEALDYICGIIALLGGLVLVWALLSKPRRAQTRLFRSPNRRT